MKLTVFTPTYNRAYTLPALYESLKRQTSRDFVWLIVDDGSTDNTREIVDGWIKEAVVDIRYYYQKNQGKMTAHNYGVRLTETELFTCVDSDDYLSDDAVEEIVKYADTLVDEIGILAYKYDIKKNRNITRINKNIISCTLKDGYDYYDMSGDTMLIYRTEIIKKYSFPKYENEKFVPEGYLYDLLDKEGKLKILHKPLYYVTYLDDGYTSNMAKVLYNNPQGYFTYINNRLKIDKKLGNKFADSIRYNAMAIAHKKEKTISNAVYPFIALLAYIPGYIFYYRRYRGL